MWAIWSSGPSPDRVIVQPIAITDSQGFQHPAAIWTAWSADELRQRLGAYPLVRAAVPPGYRVVGRTYALVDGRVVETADTEPMPVAPEVLHQAWLAERARRLAAGFDYDFGDGRGVHRFGTTPQDLEGWDEVTELAAALRARGRGEDLITISTETGIVSVSADEWADILIHAGEAVRQPIWQASFAIAAKIADGTYLTVAEVEAAAEWPAAE